MPAVCVVDGCMSYSVMKDRNGEEMKVCFFKPCTEETLRAWANVIPTKKNKVLTKNHTVCELHFEEEDVSKYHVTYWPDGSEYRVPRAKAVLKVGAVPSIFPVNKEEPETPTLVQDNSKEPVCNAELFGETDFEIVWKKCQEIPLPSDSWALQKTPEFIIWVNWMKDELYSCKRVLLYPDKKIRVFIREVEINVNFLKEIKNSGDIINLLEKISLFLPCIMADPQRPEGCEGYVILKEKSRKGRQSRLCQTCIDIRIKMNRKKRKPSVEEKLRTVSKSRRVLENVTNDALTNIEK